MITLNPISAPAVSTVDSLSNLLAILADNSRCQALLGELRAASVQAQELIGQANQQAAESATGAKELEAQRQAHAATVQQECDALAAERAALQKAQAAFETERAQHAAAHQKEQDAIAKLRRTLEARLKAVASAAAA